MVFIGLLTPSHSVAVSLLDPRSVNHFDLAACISGQRGNRQDHGVREQSTASCYAAPAHTIGSVQLSLGSIATQDAMIRNRD